MKIRLPKGASDKMNGHIAQGAPLCRLRRMDFLYIPIKITVIGRNRPLRTIQVRDGLLRTSMSVNCWSPGGISRKSQSPAQDNGMSTLCNMPMQDLLSTFWQPDPIKEKPFG